MERRTCSLGIVRVVYRLDDLRIGRQGRHLGDLKLHQHSFTDWMRGSFDLLYSRTHHCHASVYSVQDDVARAH